MNEDRARRTEDIDVVVDTVIRGWEGLAAAMASLYEQAEENSRRLAGIEQRLTQIRDLEGAVEQSLDRFQEHMRELKPSPIVVTVSHEEAEVRNTTRSGWVPDPTT
jgi:anti-sigma-K factor RskA